MEKTYVMIKPDGVNRNLIGEVITTLETKGLKLVAAKLLQLDEALAGEHYAEHKGKPFFADLVNFITSGPVFAMVWEGDDAVKLVRLLMGDKDPLEALQGTIRGKYALHTNRNIIHGSDSIASAKREIALYFDESEILSYPKASDSWL